MPGFITNHFLSIEKYLLQEMRDVEKFSEFPSVVLCHSPIEIAFLKQFFSNRRCTFNNSHFYTFGTFISELLNKFPSEYPVARIADLKFLAQNKQIHLESYTLSQFFSEENFTNQHHINPDIFATLSSLKQQIQELNWQMPHQALEKIAAHAPKLFTKCILFGFSSRDYFCTSFFKLLQKIAYHVTFFAFAWNDSEWATLELLENFFGPAENVSENSAQKFSTSQSHFVLVDDPIDAATHIQQLLLPVTMQRNTGIICPSPSFTTFITHHLETSQIPFHNGFPMPIFAPRNHLVWTWHRWQMKNNLESFIQFCHVLQHLEPSSFPHDIDICKILTQIFDDYPAVRAQDLVDFSENPYLKDILKRYPMLPKSGLFYEFLKKTSSVIPEIAGLESYFPENFQVTKEAFLNYALSHYFKLKPVTEASYPASIFLLDLPSAMHLHFDRIIIFFQDTSNFTHFPISSFQAQNIYYIAVKSNISQEFIERYRMHTGKFLDTHAMQSIYFSQKEVSQNHCNQYDSLRKIHQIRNDKHSIFGAFEYTIPEIQNYSLPITAVERAYSEPEEIWYRHILKNNRTPLLFEKNKFEGILAHNFLRYPRYSFPSFQQLQQHIASQKQYFRQKFSNILSQMLLQETLESAEKKASIIAQKLTTFETFPFIINEVDLRVPITLFDGTILPLHGRIDCILSQYPFRKTLHGDNIHNNILLIDFKTGASSQNDLQKLTKNFTNLPQSLSGLQLLLYGLMLRALGYQNIQLLILNGDPYDHAESLHLEMITSGENFKFIQKYLKILLDDGILGYSEPHPFSKIHFSSPIATLPPKGEVIQSKRKQLFSQSNHNIM
ncbi:MAG: PD-(D/E)XK nuclease family protein [Puniceicoccales bacterium]|jgi:hypothetical protein|nr:PD-(D/E)XK nuclease family protein [Puniceicoccales bacterium]